MTEAVTIAKPEYRIWKYTLSPFVNNNLVMPRDSIIQSAGAINSVVSVWALVDPLTPMVKRKVAVYATGEPIADMERYRFIDTVIIHGGTFVFHVYEDISIYNINEGENND